MQVELSREYHDPVNTMPNPDETPSSKNTNTIDLDRFLKLRGAVGTGGEAKLRIQGGEVKVNSEVETRRRRNLIQGDVVELARKVYRVDSL